MGYAACRRERMNQDGGPIFRQIADQIENSIVDGSLAEQTQAPSTTELAAFHRINPATAAKGINQLVADGVLYKRRGVGMFVVSGAREQLRKRRRSEFAQQYLSPLLAEADKLGIGTQELTNMINNGKYQR
ncbi:GntR family transcriptional regulator [soil metagenome]